MSIGNYPNARLLLLNADGTLMEGCCCVTCTGSCCCDSNLEAWFQEPLTVTISTVREATPTDPTLPSLQCLVGTWVLPYKSSGVGSLNCVWENTFNPTIIEDGVAFKITATIPKTLDASYNPTPTACLTITVEILSCKDCNGEVMNQTPEVIYEHTSSNCNQGYSASLLDIRNCGCGVGSMNKIIDGSWDSSLSGVDAALLTDIQEYGFHGQCWYHPEAQVRTATLYLSNPRIVNGSGTDVTVDFVTDLSSLVKTIGYEKDYTIPDTACQYVPVGPPVSGFDAPLTSATFIALDAGCGWLATLKRPYTDISTVSIEGAGSFSSYYTTHDFVTGCEGENPVFIRLGSFVFDSVTYYIEVQIKVVLSGPSSCLFYLGIDTPSSNCSPNFSTNYCGVDAATCGTDVGTFTLNYLGLPTSENLPADPSDAAVVGPGYVDTGAHPGISDNGSFNTSSSCGCPVSELRVCTAYDMTVTFPTKIKADDYAPAGARYEIICRVGNETGDPTDYRFVYTKSLGSLEATPANYPKGVWTLNWAPPPVFDKSWCGCADYAAGIIQNAKDRIKILPGSVPDTSLFGSGIFGQTGVDGSPFITKEITVYQRPEYGIDPCCDCSENICKDRHCNNCACDGESSLNPPGAPGPCSRNLGQHVISDYCCPCAAEVRVTGSQIFDQYGVCQNMDEPFEIHYIGTLVCDVSFDSSLDPGFDVGSSGHVETAWTCGGKCIYTWEVTETAPEGCLSTATLIGQMSGPPCAAYNCDEQRWDHAPHNYVNGADVGEVNLTACTGNRVNTTTDETITSHTFGTYTTVHNISVTEIFANTPGCSSNGHGTPGLTPIGTCTSSSFEYNCVATTASGHWVYRKILPYSEAVGIQSSFTPEAIFYYFPGNGDADCSALTGSFYISEMGDSWTDVSDPDRSVYLYTTFNYSVSSAGRCGGSTEPMGLIDVVCPVDVGILVDISSNGTVTETYDADCLNPDCVSPFYTPP